MTLRIRVPGRVPGQLLRRAALTGVLTGVLSGALTLGAGAALAQSYGQPAPAGGQYGGQYARPGQPPGQPLGQPPGQPPGQSYGDDTRAQLASLHSALKITAGQEAGWRAFVAASGPDAQQQARERSAQQMIPGLTAPQRVDLSIAAMEADLDSFRERGRALKAFYATLTPAQQKVFDRETLPNQGGYER
ncbi:MAG TPA: Spy/CpxP family protein refolding chaperone [Caulobacteraceae bacterium]|nr:Spy/CpxP family protein refolding chaperone [Caulobacteraceae bacterium]